MTNKVAVFGEALFDLIEQADGTIYPFIGGSPFNVARSFAKQNLDVSYLSPIATDEYGKRIYQYALGENISIPDGNRSELPTSLALVYKDEHGQPDYRLYRKHVADLDIDSNKLIHLLPQDLSLFHTGSLALVPSMLNVLTPVFKTLKEKKVVISLDINMRKNVEADEASYIKAVWSLLPYADIVKVSDEDLALLGIDLPFLEGAQLVLSKLTKGMVLLTQGEHGATILTNDTSISKPVYQPNQFVDAVGAGDTFFSAFLSWLLRENHIKQPWQDNALHRALEFGLMAATLNVEQNGCQPPSEAQVVKALTTRK